MDCLFMGLRDDIYFLVKGSEGKQKGEAAVIRAMWWFFCASPFCFPSLPKDGAGCHSERSEESLQSVGIVR